LRIHAFHWPRKGRTDDRADVVEAHNIALGARSGIVSFTTDMDTLNHVIPDGRSNTSSLIEVSMTTLDKVLNGRCPALLKFDVERSETEVLRGAELTLAEPDLRCVIMGLNGSGTLYGYDESVITDKMRNIGFEVCN
jgi:FkbM family methyltransferase